LKELGDRLKVGIIATCLTSRSITINCRSVSRLSFAQRQNRQKLGIHGANHGGLAFNINLYGIPRTVTASSASPDIL
jgi:hypothetical protein